jgi:ankyrin repeat protein/L-ascorbate metabolism protein UlaG (beta-lactamase superfamily)
MSRSNTLLALTAGLLCCALPALGGEIHRAIEAGDAARVQQILASDPGAVSQRDEDQFHNLPIHTAASAGNVEIARILLDAGAEIEAGDSDNTTALAVAALRGHEDLVAFLIERGADVNRRDRKADCPLSFAVAARDTVVIRRLLEAGADLYYRNPHGDTLLHNASARGLRDFVEYLLSQGAEIDAANQDGATPLGYSAMRGQIEMTRLLLDRGANPNSGRQGQLSPLFYTTWENRVECARLLLERGAQVDRPGFRGMTALQRASEAGSAEFVKLLIDHGTDVNHVDERGSTALLGAAAKGYADRVELLLAAGADPNLGKDEGGRSSLQLSALGGYAGVVRQLLAKGANPDITTPGGEPPLELARYYGNDQAASALVEGGARSGGAKRIDRSLAALGKVGDNEAVIWFLGHSGWAVKTRNHLVLFDYFSEGASPDEPALCNGHVNPSEIAGEKVAVFASHFHGDHFSPAIFEWQQQVPGISYFLGLQPQNAPSYEYMAGRMEKTVGDLRILTIPATDAGVGMVVVVDGITIFHAGDHANGRDGLMKEYKDEIDYLADKGIRPDVCFMGIRGCSLGQPPQVKEGVYYALKTLKPKVFIPMHAMGQGWAYREFVDEAQREFKSIEMAAPDNRGDHFVYKKGKIKDPKPDVTYQARAD